ncbi:flagellar M-ring protein FliF [Siculibacillus lacustris]|uniref:Flagellar M-ring protein n=1 Tax=Siculibacillus lacustris TaxID=1549641 RepID=A0A4Q9VR79_9HYPH|nr:flagellar basal-body MS-ring/collar protein FliF [Siculibacillus lacustris]TBW37389.1 flagellar M-ring protein FliF [Siculibacillus lacustris]
MNGALEFLTKLGPARLAAMAVVTALLVGFFAFITLKVTQPVMAPLYSDLSVQDSAAIVKELEAQAITYELRHEGAQIMVPKDAALRLRMKLAEKGVPTGGSVGWEIFDKSDSLGTTSYVQNINHLRALEGELARTIRSIDRVQAARVHLVIPERQVFQRDKRDPTASIALKLRGQLDGAQIRAIQHLVAAAIEGMKPGRVSIVDESGRLLASGQGEDPEGVVAASLQERTTAFETRVETQIESIVASIVGQGRARVRVTADLDYNRVTQTSDTFDPTGQVVRSTQTKEENSTNASGDKSVTVANQVPGGTQDQAGATTKEASNTSEETVNYEISKTSRTEIMEAGRIKRISVALLVDGLYTTAPDGAVTYQPRPKEDLDRIAALVRSSVGFDEKRGDQVEVVNLRFAEAPATLPLENQKTGFAALFDFGRDDILRLAELGSLLIMTLLVLLFAVRPLIKRVTGPDMITITTTEGAAGQIALPGSPGVAADGTPLPVVLGEDGQPIADPAHPTHLRLDQAKALGAVQAGSITKIGEMVLESPAEAAAIIRGWLHEAA